jgi:hypothetical protein
MPDYPLVFGFRTPPIIGRGFIAGVQIDGRALICQEDEGAWWAYGVEPGPFAESGATPLNAYEALKRAMHEVLIHSAALAASFADFKGDVEHVFGQCDADDAERWDSARREIRAGRTTAEATLDDLPRRTDEVRVGVLVVNLGDIATDRLDPNENRLDQEGIAA